MAVGLLILALAQDARIQEWLRHLQQGDLRSRLTACRSLGGVKDSAGQAKIRLELGKLQSANQQVDVYDVLAVYVYTLWDPEYGSSALGSYMNSGDLGAMEAAVAVVCELPSYKPGGYFYSSTLAALNEEKIDLKLRTALLQVAYRGPLAQVVSLLAAKDPTIRSRIVDHLDKRMTDPLLVKPLLDLTRHPLVKKSDDGKEPPRPLLERIDAWLDKLTGGEGGARAAEEWTRVKFASMLDALADKAIQKGVAALRKTQKPDGTWPYPHQTYGLGATALAVYTLLKCDVRVDDPQVLKGIEALLAQDPANTYTAALMAAAIGTALEKIKEQKKGNGLAPKLQPRLQKIVDILVASQKPCGGWHYDVQAATGTGVQQPGAKPADHFDFSNTQFAVLGLRAAANAGARVPRSTWERALALYEREHKKKDGGWSYHGDTKFSSTGTMTAAGAYGWMICKTSLNERLPLEEVKGAEPFRMASEFLAKLASPTTGGDPYYYLYSLERMCMAAGMERIGDQDWYSMGATWLLAQQGADGIWTGVYGENANTCLALLFLKRAFVRTPYIKTGK
jgi:hypothetical protein